MKINFGCGSIQPSDWTNIDIDSEYKTEHKNLNQIADNSCDIIVSHATICSIYYHDIKTILLEYSNKLYNLLKVCFINIIKVL